MAKSEFTCDCSVIHYEVVQKIRDVMLPPEVFDRVSYFFKVIGDPTRTKILWALDNHELCVCDLANLLGMTKSAVSHQLGTLRRANLVKFRRDGKTVYYSLSDDHVKHMLDGGLEHIHE